MQIDVSDSTVHLVETICPKGTKDKVLYTALKMTCWNENAEVIFEAGITCH